MKTVIIGGVAGGAGVAARLRRMDEDAQIVILEKGPYISYANCALPYYIGGIVPQREKLFVQTSESFSRRFRIDVRTFSEAVSIDRKRKCVRVRETDGREYEENYDRLVLSPGAEAIRPNIPGADAEGVFTLKDVRDTDRIKNYIQENNVEDAVVAGGGFVGLEMAENLCMAGVEVHLVEKQAQVMNPMDREMANCLHQHLYDNGVNLYLGCGIRSIENEGEELLVRLDTEESIRTRLVLLCTGVRPNTGLAKSAGLEIGPMGGISVNQYMQTSDPDIYAIGDAVEIFHRLLGKPVLLPLAGPAGKEARIAADNIAFGNQEVYRGCIGTSIVKVFHLTAASVGLNEKQLKKEGLPYMASYTHSHSRASFFPDTQMMDIKMLFHPGNGLIWGAQIVGKQGVDKRIEMFSQLILHNGKVEDLCEIEQAYAPPFSSAKDATNMAGFVAENLLKGRARLIHWNELDSLDKEHSLLLDVRTAEEHQNGHIPGSKHLALDELREHLDELPKDKEIILYCAIGLRGYLAYRILAQHGFTRIRNLSGGFRTYQMAIKQF